MHLFNTLQNRTRTSQYDARNLANGRTDMIIKTTRTESTQQGHSTRSCGTGFILNLVGIFISTRPRWSGGNVLFHCCITFEGASRVGKPLNILT